MQDHILPYMADERHAPDTLFFVAEEDFRLFARHSACQPAAGARVAEAAYAASSTAWAARTPAFVDVVNEPVALTLDELYSWRYDVAPITESQDDLFGPPAAGTDSWRKLIGGLYVPARKPTRTEATAVGVSQYLEDMVRIVTAASREGLGDLVWLSYDATDKKGHKSRVAHASTLVAVSAGGAKKLRHIVDSGEIGKQHHFDVMLLRYMQEHGNTFGASYVYPCIGHYQAHLSGSSDNEGWRDSQWLKGWVQEGTRAEHAEGGRTRWLMGWTKKGLDWKRALFLPEKGGEDLRWFTRTTAPDGWIQAQIEQRRQAAGAAKGKGKGRGKAPAIVIQPFFSQGPTEMPDDPEVSTERRKRARRAQNRDYAFRIFAGEGEQVGEKKAMSLSPGSLSVLYLLRVLYSYNY